MRKNNNKMAGMIVWHAGDATTIPDGWLMCDGGLVDVEEYPELFDAIGFRYGEAGGGQFRLPSFVDARGKGRTIRAATDDVPVGTYQDDATQKINGYMTSMYFAGGAPGADYSSEAALYYESAYVVYHLQTVAEGSPSSAAMCRTAIGFDSARAARTADETRMTNISLIPIICTGKVDAKEKYITQEAFDAFVLANAEVITALQGELASTQEDVEDAKTDIRLLKRTVTALSDDVSNVENAIEGITENIGVNSAEISQLQENVNDLDGAYANADNRITALAREIEELTGSLKRSWNYIYDLEGRIAVLEGNSGGITIDATMDDSKYQNMPDEDKNKTIAITK